MGKKRSLITGAAAGVVMLTLGGACQMPAGDVILPKVEQPKAIEGESIVRDKPCETLVGNGHYILHDYLGENTVFPKLNAINDKFIADNTNIFLNLGKTWILDHLKKAKELNKDSANPDFFDDLIKKITDTDFNVAGGYQLEKLIETLYYNFYPIILQIVECLPTTEDFNTFKSGVLFLQTESLYYGAGCLRDTDCPTIKEYQERLKQLGINYDTKKEDVLKITNDLYAVGNKVATKLGITAESFDEFVTVYTNSLDATYDRTLTRWPNISLGTGYKKICRNFDDAIYQLRWNKRTTPLPTQQNRKVHLNLNQTQKNVIIQQNYHPFNGITK